MSLACDACGAGGALAKVSLGKDFFGAPYDRLTPSSDRTPAWYCPRCSEEKRMQLDQRVIARAAEARQAGEPSPLDDPATLARATERLTEIAARLKAGMEGPDGGPFHGHLLQADAVDRLRAELAQRQA
jgi:hypothetical protein